MTAINKFFLSSLLFGVLTACTDDTSFLNPDPQTDVDLSDVPSEITDGYSLSFRFGITPMDEGAMGLTRATNQDLRAIEEFVDLEKLRILFFTCLDNNDYVDGFAKPWVEGVSTGRQYHSGKHDVFLFEAKNRWVSLLSTAQASDAEYQVTSPIFPLGNEEENDDYDWDFIRKALIERPFKIVILVNRPEQIRYSDFDGKYKEESGSQEAVGAFFFGNKGPYWGKNENKAAKALFDFAETKGFSGISDNDWYAKIEKLKDGEDQSYYGEKLYTATINDLHHCIWDPVYANKNSTSGFNWYNFIMGNPSGGVNQNYTDETAWRAADEPDAMGCVSAWTKWLKHSEWIPNDDTFSDESKYKKNGDWISNPNDKDKPMNFYYFPDQTQGIPMYGVQKFEALGEWEEGTPISLSGNGKKQVSILRSLARLELKIPKNLGDVDSPFLMYSNVFGRCEPLDVATPTNELWQDHNEASCEWFNIYKYGPIITGDHGESEENFLNKSAWFYGAWKAWWNFNENPLLYDKATGTYKDNAFDGKSKNMNGGSNPMPYPHIFNPCIQRNGYARLDFVRTDDDSEEYYHYVIYSGERNINDPNKFSNSGKGLYLANTEIAYFNFMLKPKGSSTWNNYCIAINPYNEKNKNGQTTVLRSTYMGGSVENLKSLKSETEFATDPNTWNWPIMRNHSYIFTVRSTSSTNKDQEGIDILVIDSENREAPDIFYF